MPFRSDTVRCAATSGGGICSRSMPARRSCEQKKAMLIAVFGAGQGSCWPAPHGRFPRWHHTGQPLEPSRSLMDFGRMRLAAALLTLVCLSACGGVTVSEHAPTRGDDEGRQRQVVLDAQAIQQGMAQARQRAEQLARTGRRARRSALVAASDASAALAPPAETAAAELSRWQST